MKIDLEKFVTLGTAACLVKNCEPSVALAQVFFDNRIMLAEKITGRHACFRGLLEKMTDNNSVAIGGGIPDLVSESDEMFELIKTDGCSKDVYFTILFAALGCFLERHNQTEKDIEIKWDFIRIIENATDDVNAIEDIGIQLIVTTALWFADYEGYQKAVTAKLKERAPETGVEDEYEGYIDFLPGPATKRQTQNEDLFFNMLNSKDEALLTQGPAAICRWMCSGGQGYFKNIISHANDRNREHLDSCLQGLKALCIGVAEFADKKYDVSYSYPSRNASGREEFIYKGWRLERLYKEEIYPGSREKLLLDYCLGADGKLYMIASSDKCSGISEHNIMECIVFSPSFLADPYCNVYAAAVSGVLGALDAVPIGLDDASRRTHITLDTDYYLNFPITLADDEFPYDFLDGTVRRLVGLLDEKAKERCVIKYSNLRELLYPGLVSDESGGQDNK